MAFVPAQEKNHVVFFGDSITQAGVQPGGYITVLSDMLKAKGLSDKFQLTGAGIGGNKKGQERLDHKRQKRMRHHSVR